MRRGRIKKKMPVRGQHPRCCATGQHNHGLKSIISRAHNNYSVRIWSSIKFVIVIVSTFFGFSAGSASESASSDLYSSFSKENAHTGVDGHQDSSSSFLQDIPAESQCELKHLGGKYFETNFQSAQCGWGGDCVPANGTFYFLDFSSFCFSFHG